MGGECLRLKIIERLLKEGSSADEPLNIRLSDYSSDEGDLSTASEAETKESGSFLDLDGVCGQPLKAPPCSPEPTPPESRKIKYKRMMKIMKFLDRIYFQRLVKKKRLRLMWMKQKLKMFNDLEESKEKHSKKKTKNKMDTEVACPASLDEVIPKTNLRVPKVLRTFLESQNILIIRKHKKKNLKKLLPRLKFITTRFQERVPFDLPATDPNPDLLFSTDDEIYIENPEGVGVTTHVRQSLLQSDLQRQYIIGGKYAKNACGDFKIAVRRTPPELIISTPAYDVDLDAKRSVSTEGVYESERGYCTRQTSSLHSLRTSEKNNSKLRLLSIYNCTPDFSENNKTFISAMEEPNNQDEDETVTHWIHQKDENEMLLTACSEKLAAWKQEVINEEQMPLEKTSEKELETVQEKAKNLEEIALELEQKLSGHIRKKSSSLIRIAETTKILTKLAKSKAKGAFCNTSSGVLAIHAHSKIRTTAASNSVSSIIEQPKKHSVRFCQLKPLMNAEGDEKPAGKKERRIPLVTSKMKDKAIASAVRPRRRIKRLRSITTKVPGGNMAASAVTTNTTTETNGLEICSAGVTFERKLKSKVRKKKVLVVVATEKATS